MPHFNNYVVAEILIPVIFLFFLVSGIFGAILGVGLVVFRGRVFRLFGPMNRWVSARKSLQSMEARHDIEPFVHKNRYWFCAFLILGGTLAIFLLAAKVDAVAVTSVFGFRHLTYVGPLLAQSITTFLIMGSLLAIAIGIGLGLFPRALAAFEMRANRWYSSRKVVKGIDDMHVPLDRWFESSPRTAGVILAIAALILSINAAIVLLRMS
jgi:hypothetical protein